MAVTESDIRESYREQACLAQAHRWLADVLTDPARVRAAGLPVAVVDVRDAQPNVARTPDTITVIFESPRVQRTQAEAPCSASIGLRFDVGEETLPDIRSIEVATRGVAGSTRDSGQALRSRVLSLKHRWHTLVEHPAKSTEPFREIVTDDFVMDWGEGRVTSFAELEQWVLGTTSKMSAARHDLAWFDCKAIGDTTYSAEFQFDWSGFSTRGRRMAARSRHQWRILDDPSRRFACIDRMDVEFLEPFHAVE